MAYKVLIIGCGAIAGGYDAERSPDDWPLSHAGAIARDDRFELVACIDPDDAAREAFAKRWGVPMSAPSLEALGPKPGDFDVIVIASPTQFHAEHLEWALNAKPKAVFCEKPLASDYETALRLFNAALRRKIPLAINFTRRWQPDLHELFEETRGSGWWGNLLNAVGTYSKGIVHNGCHMIDLMMMFAGNLEVQSVGPAHFDYFDDDPTVSAILTADDKSVPLHLVGSDCRALTQFELVLSYDLGEIAIRDGGMRIETRRVEDNPIVAGYRRLGEVTSTAGRYPESMAAAYDNMAAIVDRNAMAAWSEANGIAAQKICEEIRAKALEDMKKDPE